MILVLFVFFLNFFQKKLSEFFTYSALRKFPFRRPCKIPASVSPLNRIFYLLISSFSLSAIFIRHHLKLNIRISEDTRSFLRLLHNLAVKMVHRNHPLTFHGFLRIVCGLLILFIRITSSYRNSSCPKGANLEFPFPFLHLCYSTQFFSCQ